MPYIDAIHWCHMHLMQPIGSAVGVMQLTHLAGLAKRAKCCTWPLRTGQLSAKYVLSHASCVHVDACLCFILKCCFCPVAAAAAAAAVVLLCTKYSAITLAMVAIVALKRHCIQKAPISALNSRQCNQKYMQL
jgi:hypothetical protein